MPIISVEGQAIADMDTKRCLVRELTEAASKAYALPKSAIVVLLKENAPDNIGVGGELLPDRAK